MKNNNKYNHANHDDVRLWEKAKKKNAELKKYQRQIESEEQGNQKRKKEKKKKKRERERENHFPLALERMGYERWWTKAVLCKEWVPNGIIQLALSLYE